MRAAKEMEGSKAVFTATPAVDQYRAFMLDGEIFAIPLANVRDLVDYSQLVPVAELPRFIQGVIHWNGALVPVVDLSVRFGRPGSGLTRRTGILVVEVANSRECQKVGLATDAITPVMGISAADIAPPPPHARLRAGFIRGIGKVGRQAITILNVENVVSVDEVALMSTQIRRIVRDDQLNGTRHKS